MQKRREFLRTGIIGAAGLTIGGMGMTAKSYASILGANDRINVGIIGLNGRGQAHIDAWSQLKTSHNVRIATICDAHTKLLAPRAKTVLDKSGVNPKTEFDMRKIFDDKDIQVVSMATPNFWHALGTVWACQAGKDVYVEKPAMHNVWEGKKMVEAARKYNKRVQVGFQNRSISEVMDAMKFLHDGGIGKVFMARGLCIKRRDSFGIAKNSTPPEELHYDLWLGPVTWRPYNEKRDLYNWHWFWDTGSGDTGNQGPHQFDIARWGLGQDVHPVSVFSNGGLYGINPDECAQETPNTQSTTIKYDDGSTIEFETRGRASNGEGSLGIKIGNIFYGTDGYLELDGSTWKAFHIGEDKPFAQSKSAGSSNEDISLTGPSGTEHFANFLNAVRSGKDEDLHCDIREGFYSSTLPLLANISYRLKREVKFMGGELKQERIINDPDANALLTREYRAPYVVPDQV